MTRSWGFEAGRPPEWDVDLFTGGDEVDTAVITLERNRRAFAWKCSGLSEEELDARVGPSTMTLGGLLRHLAWVEELYFQTRLGGHSPRAPFDKLTLDSDWETWPWLTQGSSESRDSLKLWVGSVHHSREALVAALQAGGMAQDTASGMNLRRVLADLIEEYARHTGHADLLREEIDHLVGDEAPEEFPVP